MSEVQLRWVTPWAEGPPEDVFTAADGAFFLTFPDEREWPDHPQAGIAVANSKFAGSLHRVPAPASPATEVQITLSQPSSTLPVRVLESDETTPRPGIRLAMRGGKSFDFGWTDEEGRVTLHGQAATPLELQVESRIFGWIHAPRPLLLEQGENPELTVQFEGPPRTIDLRAHDRRTGHPIAHAVWFGFEEGGDLLESPFASQGGELQWTLAEHGEITTYCGLRVEAEGYLPTHLEWNAASPEGGLSVPMEPIALQPIQLELSRGGQPLVGTAVRLGSHIPYFHDDASNPEGGASFELGPYSGLEVEARGTTGPGGLVALDFPWVTDEPLPDRLHLRADGEDLWLSPELLGPQPWRIDFSPPTATLVLEFVDDQEHGVPQDSIEIWYDPDGENTPLIHRARTAPYRVSMRSAAYWAPSDQSRASDADGRVEFEVPAETIISWSRPVAHVRNRVVKQIESIAAGETRVVRVVVDDGGEIAGRIFESTGEEWDGHSLILRLLDANGEWITNEDGSRPRWASTYTTVREGKFRFRGVPDGRYRLSIAGANPVEEVIWVETGSEDVAIELVAQCQLDITVRDQRTGALVAGEGSVQVEGTGGGLNWSQLWDGRGVVEFPTGQDLSLVVDVAGMRGRTIPLGDVLVPGTKLTREIQLERGREVELRISPEAAVGDGRFAGVMLRKADGSPFADLPINYRTRHGTVTLMSVPREAFVVQFPIRGTREARFQVDVPAAPDTNEDGVLTTSVDVAWPQDSSEGGD